ncbi:PqqD family peptide modification chaperone [Amycolatopsis japonica]|uniref:PqqD family peptide modification chaperone n=1 Tax=Amycolatopsis japonica TaxID=208439 RepID=UPI00378B8733
MKFQLAENVGRVQLEQGGAILLDERTGKYLQLNASGNAVLRAMLNGESTRTIVENLSSGIDASMDRVTADVEEFVAAMRKKGLIRLASDV